MLTGSEREGHFAVWTGRLRAASRPVLAGMPLVEGEIEREGCLSFIEGFRDEAGHARGVDRWLLGWMLSVVPRMGDERGEDVELWRLLARREAWARPRWLREKGPLTSDGIGPAIEVWTETELSCLHALWWIGQRDGDAWLRDRALDAARWMVGNVQPDNGTNHPWAIHVFASLEAIDGSAEAGLYAQTQLHNCMVQQGKPDRLSACILWDAANCLERW